MGYTPLNNATTQDQYDERRTLYCFGASRLNLKTVEIPIRYQSRAYGSTQISRFRHGLVLARMVLFAWRKLKAL